MSHGRAGSSFVDRVRGAVVRHDMLSRGARVLCAVSGGADSLALCAALDFIREKNGFYLGVAHVDHDLREGSADDAERVRKFAVSRGLDFFSRRVAVPRRGRGGREAAARGARFLALVCLAAEARATHVALGHTADDRAETLLLFLARGAGARGLGSMQPVLLREQIRWIRPLCDVTRAETRAYAADARLPFFDDPTNADLSLSRNRLRARVVPELEALHARAAIRLARTADALAADEAFLDAQARALLAPLVTRDGDVRVVPVGALLAMPGPLRLRALRALLGEVRGGELAQGRVHFEAMNGLLRPGARHVDLPGSVAWRHGGSIFVAPRKSTHQMIASSHTADSIIGIGVPGEYTTSAEDCTSGPTD